MLEAIFTITNLKKIFLNLSFQESILVAQLFLLFFLFQIVPLFFKKKVPFLVEDFLNYQVIRGLFVTALMTLFFVAFINFYQFFGIVPVNNLPILLQVLITYLSIDGLIYICHLLVHKYRIPLLSKAHMYHHSVRENLDWTNARKEHVLILTIFTFIFFLFLFVIYKTNLVVRLTVVTIYLVLLSFSHFRIPVSIPYLDKIFLFPKDHLRHHTERSGPYGTSLSLFDTIFGTRK